MRALLFVLMLLPSLAFGYVSGIDDTDPDLSPQEQKTLDAAILTYYKAPQIEKVNTVLDMMNTTEVLRRKTAWSPLVGFLTVIFQDNKVRVFDWMSRNDYNSYAQDVIVTALMHAKLPESASVFAQAHGWSREKLAVLRSYQDDTDLKTVPIILPAHIDALWGAFFASGDPLYINRIVEVLFMKQLPPAGNIQVPPGEVLAENKRLAESTLNYYAMRDKNVAQAIQEHIRQSVDASRKAVLKKLLISHKPKPDKEHTEP